MNTLKNILIVLFITSPGYILKAQNDSDRIPHYEIPYEFPEVENIKEILTSIRVYYESTSPQTIIDGKTGEEIINFKTFNLNAEPSKGFSSEYSYTHGVVLSAFDYIDDVTGDSSFLANNSKFFDYVINNLPYFQKNSDKITKEKIGSWGRILKFHALDDCGSIGASLIKTYLKTKNEKYLESIKPQISFRINNSV